VPPALFGDPQRVSGDMGRLTTCSDKTLAETDPLDLERFAEKLAGSGLAPISQGRTLAAIRSFFRFAERIGYCRNVASGLELPRSEPASRFGGAAGEICCALAHCRARTILPPEDGV